MEAPLPPDETARLRDLYTLGLLDRPTTNPCFDRVTRLAQRTLDMPIALVSLVDVHRQWFGARQGLDAKETDRCDAFCAHTILDRETMVVPDAAEDPRFADNPLVTGDPFIRFYAGAPINSPHGHRLGTLCVIDRVPRTMNDVQLEMLRDLADIVEAELMNRSLALSDELTGLVNQRGFIEAGARLLALGTRRNEPLTILYADLDRLKETNDASGHAAGDELLRRTARVLVSCSRDSDVVARLGGDEFAVLLYDTDAAGAQTVAARIADTIAEDNLDHAERLALSVGLATTRPLETFAEVLARADHAMYRAKRGTSERVLRFDV